MFGRGPPIWTRFWYYRSTVQVGVSATMKEENRRLCGRGYIKDYLEYVCVNEIGDLTKPQRHREFSEVAQGEGNEKDQVSRSPA